MGKVLSTPNSNLTWRRDLIGSKLVMWNNLASCFATVALINLGRLDGCFQVKSHYRGLINENISNVNTGLWKLKIPLKIKIFLWYLKRGVILTKNNLTK